MSLLSLITIIPLLFYLVDGYYEKNFKKGLLHIVGFLVLGSVSILLLKTFSIKFAFSIPIIILIFILINNKKY
mgnify:FL=1